jgi:hypothetical protein
LSDTIVDVAACDDDHRLILSSMSTPTMAWSTRSMINDDYPWYVNHYAIVDAEKRITHELLHRSASPSRRHIKAIEVLVDMPGHIELDKEHDDNIEQPIIVEDKHEIIDHVLETSACDFNALMITNNDDDRSYSSTSGLVDINWTPCAENETSDLTLSDASHWLTNSTATLFDDPSMDTSIIDDTSVAMASDEQECGQMLTNSHEILESKFDDKSSQPTAFHQCQLIETSTMFEPSDTMELDANLLTNNSTNNQTKKKRKKHKKRKQDQLHSSNIECHEDTRNPLATVEPTATIDIGANSSSTNPIDIATDSTMETNLSQVEFDSNNVEYSSSHVNESTTCYINRTDHVESDTVHRVSSIEGVCHESNVASQMLTTIDMKQTKQVDDRCPTKSNVTNGLPSTNSVRIDNEPIKNSQMSKSVRRRNKKSHRLDTTMPTSLSNSQTIPSTISITRTTQSIVPPTSNSNEQPSALHTLSLISSSDESHRMPTTSATSLAKTADNKLDRFLPDYIRQQMTTNEPVSSLTTNARQPALPDVSVRTSTSSTVRRKQRPKMLNKDIEAKDLLTNEFDTLTCPNVSSSINNENEMHSYDMNHRLATNSTMKRHTVLDKLLVQSTDSDDNSENTESTTHTYTCTAHYRQEKHIHMHYGYAINRSHSNSTDMPMGSYSSSIEHHRFKQHIGSSAIDAPTSNGYDATCSGNYFSVQLPYTHISSLKLPMDEPNDHEHPSVNYDDWAQFFDDSHRSVRLPSNTIVDDYESSMDCFYAHAYSDDTLISHVMPSMSRRQQRQFVDYSQLRYGDFLQSDAVDHSFVSDMIPTCSPLSMHVPYEQVTCRLKPSEAFQRWHQHESTCMEYADDDEYVLSHSIHGLSRHVKQ